MAKPSDDERQARREADRQKACEAVEALRSSAGWKAWLSTRRHFWTYSLANQLLIAMQRADATRVAGFRAWLNLGYCVRKGERAIRIWVPVPPSKARLEAWERSGGDPAERPRTHFKLGPVFDRAQVSPLPPPAEPAPLDCPIAPVEGDELAWALGPLSGLAASIGSVVEFEAMAPERGGYYEVASCRIAINATRSINAQARSLVHELAHALLRAEPGKGERELSYAEEELVVESIAYTVCGSIGLDVSGYAIPYLANWAEQAPLETVHGAAALIDRHARRIEAVLEQQHTEMEQTV
jgi:hypothetical protein